MNRQEYPSLRQGLVGAWCPSAKSDSGMTPDRSGRNRHLPRATAHSFVASSGGVALSTNGVSSASTFNAPDALTGDVDNTISVWVSPLVASGLQGLLSFGNSSVVSNGGNVTFYYQYTNSRLLISTGSSTGEIYGNVLPSVGQWQCLTRVKQAGQLAVMYLNGIRLGTGGGQAISSFSIPSAPVVVGSNWNGANPGTVLIDDIRIYGRVLTPAEILLLASRRGIGLTPLPDRAAGLPRRFSVNVGGTWRQADSYVNVGGNWRLGQPSVNVGGVWK